MQKQLNPRLFGSSFTPYPQTPPTQAFAEGFIQAQNHSAHAPVGSDRNLNDMSRSEAHAQWQSLEERLERLQRQVQEYQGQLTHLAFQSEESLKGVRLRSDRLQSMVSQVDQKQDALVIETSQKIHFLQQKHLEQKKLEENIQSLVDRQNNLLKGYEVRMGQMQKLLAEKEAQMIATLAALNETKSELQRLKAGSPRG